MKPALYSGKVLIFAPHQDDEILSCAGLINSLIKSNAEISIVFATNGDFYGKESASIRLLESISAFVFVFPLIIQKKRNR